MFLQFAHMEDMCSSYPLHPFIKARLWDGFCKYPLPLQVSLSTFRPVETSPSHTGHIRLFPSRSLPSLNLDPSVLLQAQIQLDCGEDNICVPDLKLAVYG